MMFAKTVCNNPGSFVELVPFGLVARLQYNQNGILEKVLIPDADNQDYTEGSNALLAAARKLVPNTIQLTGGTTWVDGVFYSSNFATSTGVIPAAQCNEYVSRIESGEVFTFYSGHVESLAASFKGILATKSWLGSNKFNILPGYVVPVEVSEDSLKSVFEHGGFTYPFIAGYMIYSNTSYVYKPSGLKQCVVKSVSKFVDDDGYLKTTVKYDSGALVLDYPEVVTYNIHAASCILYYESPAIEIMNVRETDNKVREPLSPKMVCSTCKKQFILPAHGAAQCNDPQCASRMYPSIRRMLNALKLPELSSKRFHEAVDKKEIICATDVLLLPEYSKDEISCSLASVIKSVTPVTVCANDEFFERFANSCNNSVETFMYYAQHPLQIVNDLDVNSIFGSRFVNWVSDPANLLTLQTILSQVKVHYRSKKFEGSPIFRGKKFIITGKFAHGTYDDIVSILESYDGQVATSMSEHPDSVLVGDIKDGIDGNIIRAARMEGVPIFEETSFFSWHSIDSDLAANLL